MQVLLDGLFVLGLDWPAILYLLVSALGLGMWAYELVVGDDHNDPSARLLSALGLGSLVLVLLAFVLLVVGRVFPPILRWGSYLIVCLGLIGLVAGLRGAKLPGPATLFLFALAVFGLLLIRLAFLRGMVLPPYDDAPEHYAIVQDLLRPDSNLGNFYSIESLAGRYYHLGFHVLSAWICLVSGRAAADVIALLGQLFLVLLPLSVFFLTYVATHRLSAGVITATYSAFAWRMPAFAANWAKYPALAGLSLLPVVIGLWLLYWEVPTKKIMAWAALVALTLALIFMHTRLAVCLLLIGVSILFVRAFPIRRNLRFWEACVFALLTIGIFLAFGNVFFAFYGNGNFLAVGFTALLLPFSFYRSQRFTLGVSLFVLGVWIASRTPVPAAAFGPAWLDAPFVEILLSLPLALLTGTGLSGLLSQLRSPIIRRAILAVPLMLATAGLLSAKSVYPDPCCDYVKEGDIQALHWIATNTPLESVVWIPAFPARNYLVGMDAGVWVRALTGRNANKLRYDFSWDSPDALSRFCQNGHADIYVYEGGRPYSFDDTRLAEQDWLRLVFENNQAKIYQVRGACIP